MTDVDPRVERTRTRVIGAVWALLADEGLDAVTHVRVAEASGVGRATVYRHWPDTAALLFDTIRAQHGGLEAAGQAVDLPLRDAATAIVRRAVQMFRDDPLIPSMVGIIERAEHDPAFAELRRRMRAAMAGALDVLLDRAVAEGELPGDLDRDHAKALLAGPIFFARLVLDQPMGEADVQPHVDAWLRAVRHTT